YAGCIDLGENESTAGTCERDLVVEIGGEIGDVGNGAAGEEAVLDAGIPAEGPFRPQRRIADETADEKSELFDEIRIGDAGAGAGVQARADGRKSLRCRGAPRVGILEAAVAIVPCRGGHGQAERQFEAVLTGQAVAPAGRARGPE